MGSSEDTQQKLKMMLEAIVEEYVQGDLKDWITRARAQFIGFTRFAQVIEHKKGIPEEAIRNVLHLLGTIYQTNQGRMDESALNSPGARGRYYPALKALHSSETEPLMKAAGTIACYFANSTEMRKGREMGYKKVILKSLPAEIAWFFRWKQ